MGAIITTVLVGLHQEYSETTTYLVTKTVTSFSSILFLADIADLDAANSSMVATNCSFFRGQFTVRTGNKQIRLPAKNAGPGVYQSIADHLCFIMGGQIRRNR